MVTKEAAAQEISLAVVHADVKWLKKGFWLLLSAVLALHFVDPMIHVWVFQFP